MRFGLVLVWMGMAWGQAIPRPVPPVPASSSTPKWRVKFFYDKNDSSIDFREIQTPAAGMVCAFGVLVERDRGKPRGVLISSRDAGVSWQTIKLPDLPLAADFVDAQKGWMVGDDVVYRTADGGLTWQRASKLKGVLRVKFITAERGFAVGYPKAVWSTADGGSTWAKVPEAATPTAKPENTAYNTISFQDTQRGMITGFSKPPRRDDDRAPAWMDPDSQKRQSPNLTLVLQTKDSGKTWSPQMASVFGQVVKTVFGRVSLALLDYSARSFAYSSEVVNLGNSQSAFADKEKSISDMAFDGEGRVWLAGVEVPGKLNRLPIPSKVVVLQSIDSQHWYSMPVDYKAVAGRVKVSFFGTKGWLATDAGMILAYE